jgi:hypothetical protein
MLEALIFHFYLCFHQKKKNYRLCVGVILSFEISLFFIYKGFSQFSGILESSLMPAGAVSGLHRFHLVNWIAAFWQLLMLLALIF